jgi:hypothetical protein
MEKGNQGVAMAPVVGGMYEPLRWKMCLSFFFLFSFLPCSHKREEGDSN